MKTFFKVQPLESVLKLRRNFSVLGSETIPLSDSGKRILAQDILAPGDMPGFRRSTMDGYAVSAASTFGASEANPAWLSVKGTIDMGDVPDFTIGPGESARISTGGMLPKGADSVVMVEHTQAIDELSVEVYKSVAPLQHVIDASEDFAKTDRVLAKGTLIRPQEQGLLAGLGIKNIKVFKKPRAGIISTGDEVVPVDTDPAPGQVRDINSTTISGFLEQAGVVPIVYGIVKDDFEQLRATLQKALSETDTVLISGGSSVGTRDFTIDVLSSLDDTEVLVHGISLSPGKPTILAKSGKKAIWGVPGQVTSAMVVVKIVVMPFLNRIRGLDDENPDSLTRISARLTRNVSSTQGRRDFIRIKLSRETDGTLLAQPVLGKSGLIRTMIYADGLLEIKDDVEGLEKDSQVSIILL